MNVFVRHFSEFPEVKENHLQIYAVCPGWVKTDMGGPKALLSVEEGVKTIIYLINLPYFVDQIKQGKLFHNM